MTTDTETLTTPIYGTCICVVTNGFVYVAKEVSTDGNLYYLTNARIITQWGTERGLNQLIPGPTSKTVLSDPAPLAAVLPHALITLIPASDAGWQNTLG